jgi:hypothetical protein
LRREAEERLFALKFILHLVGDIHQPLHSSDNHDQGGNRIKVVVDGFRHSPKDELHGFWDTQFVDDIAKSPAALATQLVAQISRDDARTWAQRTPDDWAMGFRDCEGRCLWQSAALYGQHATPQRKLCPSS